MDELTSRLDQADSRLANLSSRVEVMMEDANKARIDAGRAEHASAAAQQLAARAALEAQFASRKVEHQHDRIDRFTAGTYRRGRAVNPLAAFAGVQHPKDALDRAELLEAISATEGDQLDRLDRARAEKARNEARSRDAMRTAEAKRQNASNARSAADSSVQTAVATQTAQEGQIRQLEAGRTSAQKQVDQVRARANLPKPRPEDAVPARPDNGSGDASTPEPAPVQEPEEDPAEDVVQRALSQVGVGYAWGGGTGSGPSRGIRDGGVADAHGDYRKIGFDCSGLMVYAFAGSGIELDHYSGYQYRSGRKVALSQIRRGDLLFWQSDGSTHHVALYLGNGRMVEAPYSGSQVRVTSVRYDGIAPSAVRMF